MLPTMYHHFLAFSHPYWMIQQPKQMVDKECQFPEIEPEPEEQVAKELRTLLQFLSFNIYVKDSDFEEFQKTNLQLITSLFKDINVAAIIRKRYIQINKTKEERIKFILRHCFSFIKGKLNYQDSEGILADQKDRQFYNSFFENDHEFLQILEKHHQTIEDMIPFRKDSKTKTMNENYLRILFQSQRFSYYYLQYLDNFKEISVQQNLEKIENMTIQILKILQTRDFSKLKSYRRFPWKEKELIECNSLAKELFEKYQKGLQPIKVNKKKVQLRNNRKGFKKHQTLSERTSEPLSEQ